MKAWRVGAMVGLVLVASCGDPATTSAPPSAPATSVVAAPGTTAGTEAPSPAALSIRGSRFLAPSEFGPGYRVAAASDKVARTGPSTRGEHLARQFAITAIDGSCRPSAWTPVDPVEWAYTWFDAPDGGLGSEELFLYASEDDAQATVAAARFTLGASMRDPACKGLNLMSPREGATPDRYELRFPVKAIDAACGVGDDCHAVVTELDPCVDDVCTPVTQVFARVRRVVVSIVYYAPAGQRTSVPIADLIPAARRAAALVAG